MVTSKTHIGVRNSCRHLFNTPRYRAHVPSAVVVTLVTLLFLSPASARKQRLPEHPIKISYPKLDWEVPLGAPHRMARENGLRVYIEEDHSLPLVTVKGFVRTGTLNDPDDKVGLGALAAGLMRTGGTKELPPDTLDELLDRLAIKASIHASATELKFEFTALAQYLDTTLYLLEQMLFQPTFEKERLEREREIALQGLRHRFDNPEPILNAAYTGVLYPEKTNARLSTESSLKSITREDLQDFHTKVMKTSNTIVAVSGDFDENAVLSKLDSLFPKDPRKKQVSFPEIEVSPAAKAVVVHKPISQAYVRMGLPLFARPHPDYYPMSVLNLILGGGGFTSRLATRVRSDEGLTYSIYSRAESKYMYPGTMYINFFTKHATVNKAIGLCLEEVEMLLKDGITDKELADAKKVLIDGLPSMFRSPADIVETYAWNEYYGRSDDHFAEYPEKIRALTRENIMRVADTYLKPGEFTYVVVGDTTQLFGEENSDSLFSLEKLSPKTVVPDDLISLPNALGAHDTVR